MSVEDTFFRIFRKPLAPPAPRRRQTPGLPIHTLRIAIINQKGGCGKTTTAVNLSAALAELGCRVLLVDLDPQAHATLGLGLRGDELSTTAHDLFTPTPAPVTQVMQPTYHPNLKLIPSNMLLASLQMELVARQGRERMLKDSLEEVAAQFHFIMLDCPPSLNLLTVNALCAATHVLVPVQTQYLSLDGMRELFKSISIVQEQLNPSLALLGILPTMYDRRTRMNRAMLETIREYFKGKVFETVIHLSHSLTECPMMGQPVTRYAPHARGADDYRRLAEELLRTHA